MTNKTQVRPDSEYLEAVLESHFLLLISLFSHLPRSSPQFPLNLPPSVRHGDVDTRLSVVLGWLPPDTQGRVSGSVLDASDMADDHSFLPLPLFHSCPLRLLHGSLKYCHRVLDGFSLSISAVIRLPRAQRRLITRLQKGQTSHPQKCCFLMKLSMQLNLQLECWKRADVWESLVHAIFMTF